MPNIRIIVRLAVVFVVCFTAATFLVPNLLADDCSGVQHIDDPPCVPTPLYYTVFTAEPDWCLLYPAGSTIYLQLGSGGATVGWYVVPTYSSSTVPPSGFSTAFWGIVSTDCSITWYIRA